MTLDGVLYHVLGKHFPTLVALRRSRLRSAAKDVQHFLFCVVWLQPIHKRVGRGRLTDGSQILQVNWPEATPGI